MTSTTCEWRSLAEVCRRAEPEASQAVIEAARKRLHRRLLWAEQHDGVAYMRPGANDRGPGTTLWTTDADMARAFRVRDVEREVRDMAGIERDEVGSSNTAAIRQTATALVAIANKLDNHEARITSLERRAGIGAWRSPEEPGQGASRHSARTRARAVQAVRAGLSIRQAAASVGVDHETVRKWLAKSPHVSAQAGGIHAEQSA